MLPTLSLCKPPPTTTAGSRSARSALPLHFNCVQQSAGGAKRLHYTGGLHKRPSVITAHKQSRKEQRSKPESILDSSYQTFASTRRKQTNAMVRSNDDSIVKSDTDEDTTAFQGFSLDRPITYKRFHEIELAQLRSKNLDSLDQPTTQVQSPVVSPCQSATKTPRQGGSMNFAEHMGQEDDVRYQKKCLFRAFREKCPKVLNKIDEWHEYNRLTPIFQEHKKKMFEFSNESPDKMDSEKFKKWEEQQRQVFVKSKQDFKNEKVRETYMGFRLNNLGLGPGSTLKTADLIEKSTLTHVEEVQRHLQSREDALNGVKPLPTLNQQQEQHHQKQKKMILANVKRRQEVGDGLTKLRAAREEITQFLKHTEDFNLRITDPEKWNRIWRQKQSEQMRELRTDRDQKKLELIDSDLAASSHHPESPCETAREKKCDFFELNKRVAGDIYSKQKLQTVKHPVTQESENLSESSDDSYELCDTRKQAQKLFDIALRFHMEDEWRMDQVNKKMQQLRKLQRANKDNLKMKNAKAVQDQTSVFIDTLILLTDPHMKNRYSAYKKMAKFDQGPGFLKRLDADCKTQETIDKIHNRQITIDQLKLLKQTLLGQSLELPNEKVLELMEQAFHSQPAKAQQSKNLELSIQKVNHLIEQQKRKSSLELSALDRLKEAIGKKLVKALHRQQTEDMQKPTLRSQPSVKKNTSTSIQQSGVIAITERDSRDVTQ